MRSVQVTKEHDISWRVTNIWVWASKLIGPTVPPKWLEPLQNDPSPQILFRKVVSEISWNEHWFPKWIFFAKRSPKFQRSQSGTPEMPPKMAGLQHFLLGKVCDLIRWTIIESHRLQLFQWFMRWYRVLQKKQPHRHQEVLLQHPLHPQLNVEVSYNGRPRLLKWLFFLKAVVYTRCAQHWVGGRGARTAPFDRVCVGGCFFWRTRYVAFFFGGISQW